MKKSSFITISIPAIIACLLWSTAFVGVKYGLQYAKPFGFAGIRFMLSGLLLAPFIFKEVKYFNQISKNIWLMLCVAFFQTFFLYACFYFGMTLLPGALGAIVVGASPLFAALTSHFIMHDDKMTSMKVVSICVGISGIVLISISRQPLTPTGFQECIGIGLLVIGGISSALGNILVSKHKGAIPPLSLNAIQIFIGGSLLFVMSLFIEGSPAWQVPTLFYLDLAWLSIMSAIAFSIWFVLLKKPGVKVSELNLWKFLIPGFGALFSWLFLPGESPETVSIVGILLVASSIILYFFKKE